MVPVESFDIVIGAGPVPNGVQQLDEVLLGLTVDLFQLDEFHCECLFPEHLCREEIRRLVTVGEYLPFGRCDNRWKLIEVADKDHLDTPEPLLAVGAVEAHEFLHAVEQIGPYHRDLVDNDGVELLIDLAFRSADLLDLFRGDARFETEKRMDCLPLHINGGDPRGCENSHLLACILPEVLEERRLPRTRLARDEHMVVRVLHDIKGLLKLRIDLNKRFAHAHPFYQR